MLYTACSFHKSIFNKNNALLKLMVQCICKIVATPFKEEDLEEGEEPL